LARNGLKEEYLLSFFDLIKGKTGNTPLFLRKTLLVIKCNSKDLLFSINSNSNSIRKLKMTWLKRDELSPFLTIRFLSLLCEQVIFYLVPLIIYIKTKNITLSGLAFFIEWTPRVIFLPFLGFLIDRYSLKYQLIFVEYIRAVLSFSIFFVSDNYLVMVTVAGFLALVSAHSWLALERLIATKKTHANQVPILQARAQIIIQLSSILGPAIGTILISRISFELIIVICTSIFFLNSFLLRKFFPNNNEDSTNQLQNKPKAQLRNLLQGFSIIYKSRALKCIILLTICLNIVEGLYLATMPALIVDIFNVEKDYVAITLSVAAIVSLVCLWTLPLILKKTSLNLLAVFSGLILVISALLIGLVTSVYSFIILFSLFMAARNGFTVWLRTKRLEFIPVNDVGKTIGIFVAAVLAAMPFSGLLLAQFGNISSLSNLIFYTALTSSSMALFVILYQPRLFARSNSTSS